MADWSAGQSMEQEMLLEELDIDSGQTERHRHSSSKTPESLKPLRNCHRQLSYDPDIKFKVRGGGFSSHLTTSSNQH